MVSCYDAYAREAYWLAVADNPLANKATKEVATAEARAWRQVAATIKLLGQATPFEYAEAEPERQRIERDMTERMLDDVEIFDGLDRAKARHVASGRPERLNDFPR